MNVIKQAAEHLDLVCERLRGEAESVEAQAVKLEHQAENWRKDAERRKKEIHDLNDVVAALETYAEEYEGF